MAEPSHLLLYALLAQYGVDIEILTGPQGPARTDMARIASRVLLELAEGVHPGPLSDFLAGV